MINTQYTCNRCRQKVDQIFYCHDQEYGICYSCSKQKDKCSICNKKSNIPVKSSSKYTRSGIKQNCNFCEKLISVTDKQIKTECKHTICVECIVKKICYVVKSYKNTSKDKQENPLLRIKCNCLRGQNINLQQFLKDNCFCCGQSIENNSYQQLLYGLRILWRCKAIFWPEDYRNYYNQEQINKADVQKLSKRQNNQQSIQQLKQEKEQKDKKSKKQEKIDNNSQKSSGNQKNIKQLSSSKQQNKAIDNNQKPLLFCQSCDCPSDRCSLIFVDDSFYLCSSCQFKSKSYHSTHNKIKSQQSYKDQNAIDLQRQSMKDKQMKKKNRIFFQKDLFQFKQQLPKQKQIENSQKKIEINRESTCLSCDKTFSLFSTSKNKDQSQMSDMFCRQCIEINHKILKKQEQPQKKEKWCPFFKNKSLKDMTYSEYLKQIIILQSPEIIQEPSQLSLKRRPSQQNKDRRAIYSVVQEFPEFQQLQIICEQGQTAYCYNCKLFACKSNLIDCSEKLKKKSLACKMCFFILFNK